MTDSSSRELSVSDERTYELSLARQADVVCDTVATMTHLEPRGIILELINAELLPPELYAELREPILAMIERIRDNAKAAAGKSVHLATALRADSQTAVTDFLAINQSRIEQVMLLSSNVMHQLAMTTRILGVKDLESVPADELQDGLLSIMDLHSVVNNRVLETITVRLAETLASEGISCTPNKADAHEDKFESGVLFTGTRHYEAAIVRVKTLLEEGYPQVDFWIQSAGFIPSRAIRISVKGKKG